MQAPNNVVTDYAYDSLNRLDQQTDYRTDGSVADIADLSDNTVIADYDYTVRADGKRTGLSETFENGVSNDYTWTYDSLSRLVAEEIDSSDNTLDETTTYEYDLAGNRTKLTRDLGSDAIPDDTITYTHDANDRLLTETSNTGKSTTYNYDHTQQTFKDVNNADGSSVETSFTYDLQGRMQTAMITTKNVGQTVTRIEKNTYDYDTMGIRISALQEIDSNADATWNERKRTEFLVDHQNHTGYQQVVRETHYDADTDVKTKTVDYSFGHDEITQTTRAFDALGAVTSETTLVFGHDSHGSTRVLTDLAAAITEMYVYDAYGQMLAIFNGTGTLTSGGNGVYADASLALTNLLYSGEQFDTRIGQQYLRARYYDPATGVFNRLDPFFGNHQDPQSFHKYLYTHADPVNGVDPTGERLGMIALATAAAFVVGVTAFLAFTDWELIAFSNLNWKKREFANQAGTVFTSKELRPFYAEKLAKGFEKRKAQWPELYKAMNLSTLEEELLDTSKNHVQHIVVLPGLDASIAAVYNSHYDAIGVRSLGAFDDDPLAGVSFHTWAHETVHAVDDKNGWYDDEFDQEALAYATQYHLEAFDELVNVGLLGVNGAPAEEARRLDKFFTLYNEGEFHEQFAIEVAVMDGDRRPLTHGDLLIARQHFGVRLNEAAIKQVFKASDPKVVH